MCIRDRHNLGVGSGPHGQQTGRMLELIEQILSAESPRAVLLYGDTNSTLAGALAAAKLHLPVAHVEAGVRSFNRAMPEEINRVVTDHIADWLFCPSAVARDNLQSEGITSGVFVVGDVMYDCWLRGAEDECERSGVLSELSLLDAGDSPERFCLATIHRPENTESPERLRSIVSALEAIPMRVVLPLHPRTRDAASHLHLGSRGDVAVIEPLGYAGMQELERSASLIVTDSGGVQKEAYFAGVPCITARDETEWVETVESGWNRVVGADRDEIINCADYYYSWSPPERKELYGDGAAAQHIASELVQLLSAR